MPNEQESLFAAVDALLEEAAAKDALPHPDERKRLREAAGLSQDQIAKALSVRRETVTSWEIGRTAPRPPKRAAYARLLEGLATLHPVNGVTTEPAAAPARPTSSRATTPEPEPAEPNPTVNAVNAPEPEPKTEADPDQRTPAGTATPEAPRPTATVNGVDALQPKAQPGAEPDDPTPTGTATPEAAEAPPPPPPRPPPPPPARRAGGRAAGGAR
ncbi:helix-turn-helix transcriptional regulator, partial [Streptomyces sp. NPDC059835]|uniref:helix-turn-helix transcriptional regulator n=1 Tax=Streptomyces sp. NPDC059835 TaxID=3346967 RepID=UPI00365DB591